MFFEALKKFTTGDSVLTHSLEAELVQVFYFMERNGLQTTGKAQNPELWAGYILAHCLSSQPPNPTALTLVLSDLVCNFTFHFIPFCSVPLQEIGTFLL